MPTPKRWCPISRDLNDDPEVWELTDRFGDRSLRIFFEVTACIDRGENKWRLTGHWLASLSRKVRQQPTTVSLALGWMVEKGWLIVEERSTDGSPSVYSARNYWKYHKRREPNGATSATDTEPNGSRAKAPSYPNLPLTNLNEEEREPVDIVNVGDITGDRKNEERSLGVGNMKARVPRRADQNGFSSIGSVVGQIMNKWDLASK